MSTLEEMLGLARSGLSRVDPHGAFASLADGAVLIDIRGDAQIAADGVVPGALLIQRNVLEWRVEPGGAHRHPEAPGVDAHVIVMCNEGYASSFAAATLQQLGFARATDLDGGFQAWRAAGLPVEPPAAGRRA